MRSLVFLLNLLELQTGSRSANAVFAFFIRCSTAFLVRPSFKMTDPRYQNSSTSPTSFPLTTTGAGFKVLIRTYHRLWSFLTLNMYYGEGCNPTHSTEIYKKKIHGKSIEISIAGYIGLANWSKIFYVTFLVSISSIVRVPLLLNRSLLF